MLTKGAHKEHVWQFLRIFTFVILYTFHSSGFDKTAVINCSGITDLCKWVGITNVTWRYSTVNTYILCMQCFCIWTVFVHYSSAWTNIYITLSMLENQVKMELWSRFMLLEIASENLYLLRGSVSHQNCNIHLSITYCNN